MNYKTHPGVVMTDICGIPVLIPLRVAYPELQRMIRLPLPMVPLWDYLSNGKNVEFFVKQFSMLMPGKEEIIRKKALIFCDELCKLGYLVEAPDNAPAEGTQPESENANVPQNT